MDASPLIEFEDVSFAYDGPPVLEHVSLAISAGDLACIIGPNGGGKSTLVKLMLGLLEPASGRVRVFGRSPQQARARVGYLPQHTHFDTQFPVCVIDVVLMGCVRALPAWGARQRSNLAAARRALREVGLDGLERRAFAVLSGGQRQRVLIARALAGEPSLLVLDEPTAGLDITAEEQLYALLRKLNERLTIVLVSHDVGFVSSYVKTAICVNRTVHCHDSREVSSEVIEELFGRRVRAIHHPAHGQRAEATGDTP